MPRGLRASGAGYLGDKRFSWLASSVGSPRSKGIKIYSGLLNTGETGLTSVVNYSNPCRKVLARRMSLAPRRTNVELGGYPQRWAPLPRNDRKCAKAFDSRATTQEHSPPGLSANLAAPCPAGSTRFVPLRLRRPQLQRGLGKGTALLGRATATHDGGERNNRQRREAGC